jgi:hypothetical protein
MKAIPLSAADPAGRKKRPGKIELHHSLGKHAALTKSAGIGQAKVVTAKDRTAAAPVGASLDFHGAKLA